VANERGVGPLRTFHRQATGKLNQDFKTVVSQVGTKEIWGGKDSMYGNGFPSVRAFLGPLPDGKDGIEFQTTVLPTPGGETKTEVYWAYHKQSDWVESREGEEFAAIRVDILKVRYTKELNLQPNVEWKK